MKAGTKQVAVASGMLLCACGCVKKESTPAAPVPVVRVAKVDWTADDPGTRYSLTLMPFRQADLSFKSAGIVASIRQVQDPNGQMREVTMGDAAPAGLLLARVRVIDYQQKVESARAELAQAAAKVESTRSSQRLASVNYERAARLLQDESITKQNYDSAVQQRDSAVADVKQAEANMANSQVQLAQAQLELQDTELVSPFDAVVISRQVELGNLAGSNTTAFVVADIHALKADFTVPDRSLSDVSVGRKVEVQLPGADQPVAATVTSVSPSADVQSRVFTVEVTIPNRQRRFKPGMTGSLVIKTHSEQGAHLVIPLAALARNPANGEYCVFVAQGEGDVVRTQAQPVSIGPTNGTGVEIEQGLHAGQRVITAGSQTVHDGEVVRVLE